MKDRSCRSSSRRAFVLTGSAALTAGASSMAGASAAAADSRSVQEQLEPLQAALQRARDREAIRQLHIAYSAGIEDQAYEAVAELFDETAHLQLNGITANGKAAIRRLLVDQYRNQTLGAIHSAYRPNALQQEDVLALCDDGLRATATWHTDVKVSSPLEGDCTAAQMARLQGQMGDCRWECGWFEAQYVKLRGEWKIASLVYHRA